MSILVTALVVLLALAIVLSTALFGVEVSVKRRGMSGQGIGFTFSAIATIFYFVVFCDKLPGHPTALRDLLLILPGVHEADIHFASSLAILFALIVVYALRLGIYTRLFIIPALTMTDDEYNSPDQVELRANDLSAPVLAYLAFALVTTAGIAGAYSLPALAGAAICLVLFAIYFVSSYLRNLRNSAIWLIVQLKIMSRNFWLLASRVVVRIIVFIGWLEVWRRRIQPGDEQFFAGLEERLKRLERKARLKNREERELLRRLASRSERVPNG